MGVGTVISSIVAMVLSLALVLGLAYGVLWALRRFQDRSMKGAEGEDGAMSLRFVRALPLGPRERVVLVETGGETLMLGVTAGAITVLAKWNADGQAVAFDQALGRAPVLTGPAPTAKGGPASWR